MLIEYIELPNWIDTVLREIKLEAYLDRDMYPELVCIKVQEAVPFL